MSENRMDPTSEEYALYCEENEDGWHRCYDETEQQFSDDVSASIAARDHDRFCHLAQDPGLQGILKNRSVYRFVRLIYAIYKNEAAGNVTPTILDQAESLDALISEVINKARFLLWRVEFAEDPDAVSQLIDMVLKQRISVYGISVLIDTGSIKKEEMYREVIGGLQNLTEQL